MQGLERTVADLQVVPTEIDSGPAFIATLRDVSELVRAEEGERLKAKELETLARIGNILAQDRLLSIKCTEALEVLTEVVQADYSTIRVREGKGRTLRLVAQSGSGRMSAHSAIAAHRSAAAEALHTEASIILNNYSSDPLADTLDVNRGIKSAVVLPIRSDGQIVGLISVVAKKEGHFTIERIEMLTTICAALGVILENVSLSEQLGAESEEWNLAQEARREADDRFRDLVEAFGQIWWETDMDSVYTFCSPNVKSALGYDPDEMIGRSLFDFIPSAEAMRMKVVIGSKTAWGQEFSSVEHEVLCKNGQMGTIKTNGKPVLDTTGISVGYRRVSRDISAHKEGEREKRNLEVDALAQSKLTTLGEVANGVAHEINPPLTYISTMIQAFQQDLELGDLDTDSTKRRLSQAITQVERISGIVRHLQSFGQRDQEGFRPVWLRDVLDNALVLVNDRMRSRKIRVETEVPVDLPPVFGNAFQLEQVFTNLFQNSINAFQDKPEGAKITVAAVANEDGKGVKIDISDNGTGIAPADREKIFEPFFSGRQDGQGAGLGLAIVSGVMRDHSGSINFETEWGRGNLYDVSLPGCGDAPVT
jgi:PAS domain S-box-containing protein